MVGEWCMGECGGSRVGDTEELVLQECKGGQRNKMPSILAPVMMVGEGGGGGMGGYGGGRVPDRRTRCC